jgi:hypothetical protein
MLMACGSGGKGQSATDDAMRAAAPSAHTPADAGVEPPVRLDPDLADTAKMHLASYAALIARDLALDELTLTPTSATRMGFVATVSGRASGPITGWIDMAGSGVDISVKAERMTVGTGPRDALTDDVALRGEVAFELLAYLPAADWSKASGRLTVTCDACGLTSYRAKPATPTRGRRGRRARDFAGEGVLVPSLSLTGSSVTIEVEQGKATVAFADSSDADLRLAGAGTLALAPSLADSTIDLCLAVDFSDAAKAASPLLENLASLTGAGPGEAMHLGGRGPLGGVRWRPRTACDASSGTPPTRPRVNVK